jgi:hypothetical protein
MAQLREQYTLQQAEAGAVSIQVWPGSGTNLDFTNTGQFVYRAWLDDPSRVQVDTDTPIENANAQIIHLRKIHQINVEGLPSTGVTLLSVATIDAAGQRYLYQFPVSYGDARPAYATISLVPGASRQGAAIGTAYNGTAYNGIDLATFEAGISQLILNGTIAGNGPMHERLASFVAAVRNGSTPAEAAQTAGVSQAVIAEVEAVGAASRADQLRLELSVEDASDSQIEPLVHPQLEEGDGSLEVEPVVDAFIDALPEALGEDAP